MASYRLTSDAKSDLIALHRYTLQRLGGAQSQKYLSGLRETMRLIGQTPAIGTLRPELGERVQSFPYVSHVIYYLAEQPQVVVFAVLHKRMVPLNHLSARAGL
jgi:toxin ParE1/3/4